MTNERSADGPDEGQRIDIDAPNRSEGERGAASEEGSAGDGTTESTADADENRGTVEMEYDTEKWQRKLTELEEKLRTAEDEEREAALREQLRDLRSKLEEAGILDELDSSEAEGSGSGRDTAEPDVERERDTEPDVERERDTEPDRDVGTDLGEDAGPDGWETTAPGRDDESDPAGHDDRGPGSDGDPGTSIPVRAGSDSDSDFDSDSDDRTTGDAETESSDLAEQSTGSAETGTDGTTEPTRDGSSTGDDDPDGTTEVATAGSTPDNTDHASADGTGAEDTAKGAPEGAEQVPSDETGATEATGTERADVEALREDIDEAVARIDDLESLVSEYRRRNEREHEVLKKEAVEDMAGRMLNVRETLLRIVEYGGADDATADQLRSVVRQFDQHFTAGAIEAIDPDRGDEVDDVKHTLAGPREPAEDVDPNRVLRVERKGFEISGYPLRQAEVIASERE